MPTAAAVLNDLISTPARIGKLANTLCTYTKHIHTNPIHSVTLPDGEARGSHHDVPVAKNGTVVLLSANLLNSQFHDVGLSDTGRLVGFNDVSGNGVAETSYRVRNRNREPLTVTYPDRMKLPYDVKLTGLAVQNVGT